MAARTRGQRLQVMLTALELSKVDDWRFIQRMPSRAAAVRLCRGPLRAFDIAPSASRSEDFPVANGTEE